MKEKRPRKHNKCANVHKGIHLLHLGRSQRDRERDTHWTRHRGSKYCDCATCTVYWGWLGKRNNSFLCPIAYSLGCRPIYDKWSLLLTCPIHALISHSCPAVHSSTSSPNSFSSSCFCESSNSFKSSQRAKAADWGGWQFVVSQQ